MAIDDIYEVGEVVECSVVFGDAEGNRVDPGSVTFKIRKPDNTLTTLVFGTDAAVERDAAGEYHSDVTVNQSGIWKFRWEGTGTGQSADDDWFFVEAAEF